MQPLIIYVNRIKLFLAALMCIALGLGIGIGGWSKNWMIALFGMLFFLAAACILLSGVRKQQKVIEANEQGLYFYPVGLIKGNYSYLFFPWEDIKDFSTYEAYNQCYLAIQIASQEALLSKQHNSTAQEAIRKGMLQPNLYVHTLSALAGRAPTLVKKLKNYRQILIQSYEKQ